MNEFILRDPNISFLPNPHITTRLRWEFGWPAGLAQNHFSNGGEVLKGFHSEF